MRQLQRQEWKEEYNENVIIVCYFIVIYGHILYTFIARDIYIYIYSIIQQPPK